MKRSNVKIALILILLLPLLSLQGQDIHFSQYNRSPLILNPAQTGHFSGRYRVGINYRDQWQFYNAPFKTVSAYMDSRILNKRVLDGGCETINNYFGLGGYVYADEAGDANLSNTNIMLTMAYHKQLSPSLYGSIGFAAGLGNKKIDVQALQFLSQWQDSYYSSTLPAEIEGMESAFTYFDLNAGILIVDSITATTAIWLGSSLNHINEPRNGFLMDNSTLPRKINVHGGVSFGKRNWNYQISVLATEQNQFNEIIGNFGVTYNSKPAETKLTKSKVDKYSKGLRFADYKLMMGMGIRLMPVRDVIPQFGIEFKDFVLTMSYDVSFMSKHINNPYRGGFEIALRKIF